jgi:hypothetical protein
VSGNEFVRIVPSWNVQDFDSFRSLLLGVLVSVLPTFKVMPFGFVDYFGTALCFKGEKKVETTEPSFFIPS